MRIALRTLGIVIAAGYAHDVWVALRGGWIGGDGLSDRVSSALASHAIPGFYRSFLEDIVLPHDQLFTVLVLLASAAVIIPLLAGRFVIVAALLALFLQVNYLLLNGWGSIFDLAFIAIELAIVALTAALRSTRVDPGAHAPGSR